MKRNIIALSGAKNSGKDTAANMLQYCLNTPKFMHHYWLFNILFGLDECDCWKRIAFADPLKDMLSVLFSIPREDFDDRKKKETVLINPTNFKTIPYSTKRLTDNQFKKAIEQENEDLIKTSALTLRQAMQWYGTNVLPKVLGSNVWVDIALNTPGNLLISDVRFIKEAEAIKNRQGKIILIERPDITITSNHISEIEWKTMKENGMYDYIIVNDGSLKDLFNKIKNCGLF